MDKLNPTEEETFYNAGREAYFSGKDIHDVPVYEIHDDLRGEEYHNLKNRSWVHGFNDAMVEKFQPLDSD